MAVAQVNPGKDQASDMRLAIASEHNPAEHPAPTLIINGGYYQLTFEAMAGSCELLIDLNGSEPAAEQALAELLSQQAVIETWRIEHKYSRYCGDNWYQRIHQHRGQWQTLDAETERLIVFADQAWRLSEGLFDITSGILGRVWRFDGSDRIPDSIQVDELLPYIGWDRVQWRPAATARSGAIEPGQLFLPEGMSLDFGGIGKEYAVDRVLGLSLQLLQRWSQPMRGSLLVNFGGDIACSGPRCNGQPWMVAIEAPDTEQSRAALLQLSGGGLATSGDSRRFLLKQGQRYSHLLNPKTGWPVLDAARSVTVAAPTCSQSGLIATLALLQGAQAESFLQQTGLKYWLMR